VVPAAHSVQNALRADCPGRELCPHLRKRRSLSACQLA
jgi:hypothetical protein